MLLGRTSRLASPILASICPRRPVFGALARIASLYTRNCLAAPQVPVPSYDKLIIERSVCGTYSGPLCTVTIPTTASRVFCCRGSPAYGLRAWVIGMRRCLTRQFYSPRPSSLAEYKATLCKRLNNTAGLKSGTSTESRQV